MGKYLLYAKNNFQDTIAYRGPAFIWLLGNFLSLLIMVLVWLSAGESESYAGYTRSELVTYYILSLFIQWFAGWFPYYNVKESIQNGSIIGKVIIKPVSMFGKYLSEEFGLRIFYVALGLISTAVFAFLFSDYFVLNLDIARIPIFLLSLVLAILITFSFSLCMGMLAFWFT